MTEEGALKVLNLNAEAGPQQIEAAYQRLLRRYPPEFNPDKFREIDEAYRFLTSFIYRLEQAFSPNAIKTKNLVFEPSPVDLYIKGALQEIAVYYRIAYLWGLDPSVKKKTRGIKKGTKSKG